MENFIAFNSLNIFSLVILAVLFFHAKSSFENENSKHKAIWKQVLLIAVIVQIVDISSWYVNENSTQLAIFFNYTLNILLFTFSTLLAAKVAIFIDYGIEYSSGSLKKLEKLFYGLVGLNFIMLLSSVFFGTVFFINGEGYYTRSTLYSVTIAILFLPLIIVLYKLITKYRLRINKVIRDNNLIVILLVTNILGGFGLIILQGMYDIQFAVLMPFVTLFILLLHLIFVTNGLLIDHTTGLQNILGVEKYFAKIPKTLPNLFAVLFFDLDDLKEINDEFGHKEGDKAIKAFSNILQTQARGGDLVARIGGDEFLVASEITNTDQIDRFLARIKKQVEVLNTQLKDYQISYSYGLSICSPNKVINKAAMIEDADNKMYQNKQQNKI